MERLELDAATKKRIVEQLAFTLQAFHEAYKKNEYGHESVSYRGRLGGIRAALTDIIGAGATSKLLEVVRKQTGLPFPHVGPVMDNGDILGMDSEAAPRL